MEDIDNLSAYLRGQVGWVPLEKIRKSIQPKYADNRKIEACRYVGLLERDGSNVRLSSEGREYATATDDAVKSDVMKRRIVSVSLYRETLEWIHWSKVAEPTRTDVGNYWHDKHPEKLEGAQGAALTDAVVFFFRIAAAAGLGKFIPSGNNRPTTLLRADLPAIEALISVPVAANVDTGVNGSAQESVSQSAVSTEPPASVRPAAPFVQSSNGDSPEQFVTTSPAVHINLEIHIAADATPETVAEIFKNMRKYVLNKPVDND